MERKINSEKGINYLCRLEAQRNASEAIKLDPLEERMLICLATAWHVGKEITVLEAMRSCSQMSSTKSQQQVSAHFSAMNVPDLPPCFSKSFTSVMIMPLSTALHMS